MRSVLSILVASLAVACGAAEEPLSTQCEGDFLVYEPGLTIPTDSGAFDLVFVSATPDPPDEGVNDWVIEVTTPDGQPVDAEVIVTPWMPAHGHGVSPPDYAGRPTDTMGELEVASFDLIMPGTWEFQIQVSTASADDSVAPAFCIEG